jgi:hypothetical protein
MLGHLLGHLNLVAVFPLPLMAEISLLRLNGRIGAGCYVLALSLLISIQFLCFSELAATATLFGAAAIVCAWWITPLWRTQLRGLTPPLVIAYLVTAVFLGPYLYYFLVSWNAGARSSNNALVDLVSAHLSHFLIPTTANMLGSLALVRAASPRYLIHETGSYIAFPILFVLVSLWRSRRQYWPIRLLLGLLAIVCIASIGPIIHIGERGSLPMPWLLFSHLPLLDTMLPARFSVYCFLIIGIIVCLWLNDSTKRRRVRIVGACAIILFNIPNLSASYWAMRVDEPSFFHDRLYTHYLSRGDNVLILPFGMKGNSNIWQASTSLYFHMAGGYVGSPLMPVEVAPYYPLVISFYNLVDFPLSSEMLKTFLAQDKVDAIIVADQGAQLWQEDNVSGLRSPRLRAFSEDERRAIATLLASLGVMPIRVGGVAFYKVPLERLSRYRYLRPEDLDLQIGASQMNALIAAAHAFASSGRRLADLSPVEARRLGLLPPLWVNEGGLGSFNPSAPTQNGLTLTGANNEQVVLGIVGAQSVIKTIAPKYIPCSLGDYVAPWPGQQAQKGSLWLLLIEYSRVQLSCTAAQICSCASSVR